MSQSHVFGYGNTYSLIGCAIKHMHCKFMWANVCIDCRVCSLVDCVLGCTCCKLVLSRWAYCLYYVISDRLCACLIDCVLILLLLLPLPLFSFVLC